MTSSNEKGAQQLGGRPSRGAINAVRGTRDLLPDQTPLWNRVEATARAVFARYGFGEIRTPVFEATELFALAGRGSKNPVIADQVSTRGRHDPGCEVPRRRRTTHETWKRLSRNSARFRPRFALASLPDVHLHGKARGGADFSRIRPAAAQCGGRRDSG